jgi:glycosyltransferase involved in cell wall biosynthesis
VRLAVFSDDPYACVGGTTYGEMAFTLFLVSLRQHLERLVIVGRLDSAPHRGRFELPPQVGFTPLPYARDLSRPLEVARGLLPALARFWRVLDEVDAVWLLGPSPMGLLFAALAGIRGRAVAIGVRMSYPDYIRHRHPERRDLQLAADALDGAWRCLARAVPTVVVGSDLARRYGSARRLLASWISLVAAGDVLEEAAALGRNYADRLRLLAVGRIDAEKNPLLLADVLAGLRQHDERWRLTVCGDGALSGTLASRMRELGVAEACELRGHVPAPELREIYRDSHAFVHVSWTEGVPQVLFEAFAAGVPVVATDVGGVHELAARGEAALLVRPGDAGAVIAALRRVADDEQLRTRLVKAGLDLARRYTIEAQSRAVVRFLSDSQP